MNKPSIFVFSQDGDAIVDLCRSVIRIIPALDGGWSVAVFQGEHYHVDLFTHEEKEECLNYLGRLADRIEFYAAVFRQV